VELASQALNHYLDAFNRFEKSAGGPDWLREQRATGFARFCETGFPTTHVEDWRFTNVAAIADANFHLASKSAALPSLKDIAPYRLAGAACQLVFVNGRYAPSLSTLDKLPEGVKVASLAAQLAENPQELRAHLGQYLDIQRDPFCALNAAFLEDGAYVHIRRRVVAPEPIYLLFVSTAGTAPLMNHPRNLIVAEESSEATIVENYVSLGGGVALSNTATELFAEDQAVISHYMIESEDKAAFNISTLRIQQGRGANTASHSVLLGGAIVRNNVHPVLAGEGGECLINGLYIGSGRQHLDNYMLVEHAAPRCASRQFYNGILDDSSRGVFHGRIVVHKDAQKTDAKQTNRNLLLSDNAQVDTKPQLEIYADDVKCTHGATIGQIEDTALFYLRSRGIDEITARSMLLGAFAGECLDRMKEGLAKALVQELIDETLLDVAHPNKVRARQTAR
jgi:Fe-S cluster assembly protein SufD